MSLKKEKSDEILNLLLRGNFDYIKDESLDIDLSKCAPILPTINNSLSNFPWQLGETELLINTNSQCDDSTNANDMEPLLFKRNNYLTDNSITFQSKELNLSPPTPLDIKSNSIKFPSENQPNLLLQNNEYSKNQISQFELKNFKVSKLKEINMSKKLKQPQKQNLRKQHEPKKTNPKMVKHSKIMNNFVKLEPLTNNLSDKRNFPLPEISSAIQHNLQNSSFNQTSSEIPLKLQNPIIQGSKLNPILLERPVTTPLTMSTNKSGSVLNLDNKKKSNDKNTATTPIQFPQNILNTIRLPIQIQQHLHASNQVQQANLSNQIQQVNVSNQIHETAQSIRPLSPNLMRQQIIGKNQSEQMSEQIKNHLSNLTRAQLISSASNQISQQINSSGHAPQSKIIGNSIEQIPQKNNLPLETEKCINKKQQKKIDEKLPELSSIKQTNTTKYKCDSCDLIFDSLSDLKASNSHLPEHIVTLICYECNKEFLNEAGLKKHFKTHSNSICRSAMMECPDCGKLLKLGSMWMHRKSHINGKKSNVTQNGKHNNNEKTFECPDCGKCFPERSHMIRHQKYHNSERPYKCEKCGKMYKTERCLKVHSLVHLDQRPFSCAVCQKSFLSNSKLKQHSNIHTGERPYKCNYCSRDFTNFPNWLKHTRRRHNVDHKTGEALQKMPKYCSKTKKKQVASKSENDKEKEVQTQTKSNTEHENLINPIKLKEEDNKIDIKEEILKIHDEMLKTPNLKLIKLEPSANDRNFSDLHSLSITSTEDLLMEQALEMEEQAAVYFNTNQNSIHQDHIDPDAKLFNALHSIESSPLSSPASDFQNYMPLPPITTVSNNFYLNSQNKNINLPSMNACFLASNNYQ